MRRTLFSIVCLASAVARSQAAIDLPPTLSEYTANGMIFKELVFKDGDRQITYELPQQWCHRSLGDSVKLIPKSDSTADIAIQAIPLTAPQPLEKGVSAAHDHFVRGMPPAVQALKIVSEEQNTIPFRAGSNCEITATYQALGQAFTRRALYISLPDTQLIFRLTARQNEFESLWRTFRGSILSWQWIEPSVPAGPRTASTAR